MPVASKESHRVVVSYPCPNDCFFRLSGGSANNSRAERRGWRRRLRLAEGAPRSGSARQQRDRNRQCAEQKAALAIDVLSHKCSQCRGAAEQLGPGGCLPTVLAGGALAGAAPPPPPSPASSPPRSGGTARSCGGLLMRWQVPHGRGGRNTTSHVVEIVTARFFRLNQSRPDSRQEVRPQRFVRRLPRRSCFINPSLFADAPGRYYYRRPRQDGATRRLRAWSCCCACVVVHTALFPAPPAVRRCCYYRCGLLGARAAARHRHRRGHRPQLLHLADGDGAALVAQGEAP